MPGARSQRGSYPFVPCQRAGACVGGGRGPRAAVRDLRTLRAEGGRFGGDVAGCGQEGVFGFRDAVESAGHGRGAGGGRRTMGIAKGFVL